VEKCIAKTDNCREKHCKNKPLWKKNTAKIDHCGKNTLEQ